MSPADLIPITVYVPPEDKAALESLARANDRVTSVEGRRAIRAYLSEGGIEADPTVKRALRVMPLARDLVEALDRMNKGVAISERARTARDNLRHALDS